VRVGPAPELGRAGLHPPETEPGEHQPEDDREVLDLHEREHRAPDGEDRQPERARRHLDPLPDVEHRPVAGPDLVDDAEVDEGVFLDPAMGPPEDHHERHRDSHGLGARRAGPLRIVAGHGAATEHDLATPGLNRRKLLAAMVCILDRTFMRVGDERYRRDNGSYGLTTLRTKHVRVSGDRIRLRFRGKSGKEHDVALADRRLARIVRHCLDLPGYELFQYMEDGERRRIFATDVNEYLQEISGADYTAKDFRTWGATVIATVLLTRYGPASSATERTRTVNRALRAAAQALRNTLAVCRKSYVHPGVVDAYLADALPPRRLKRRYAGLSVAESRTLSLLKKLQAAPKTPVKPRTRTRAVDRARLTPPALPAA